MEKKRRVSFITLGCKVNQYETDGMAEQLTRAGYAVVPFEEGADVTIINTCAVTNIAQRKSRQMMSRAKKKNPQTVVVAVGCYIQNEADKLDTLPEVDMFLGNNQKKQIVSFLEMYFQNQTRQAHVIDINHTSEYEEFSIGATKEHARAYVKIQDGCNQFCSYCIIPYVRGRVRSRDWKDILKEAEQLAQDGYREIVLTGIHISSYGVDQPESGMNLLLLLEKLQAVTGISRIRLGSLEPRIITEEFAHAIVKLDKICPHFHLSLQSGCDATLKRMNRHYTTKEYEQSVQLLRSVYEDPAITTDVIVGFPGETPEEFAQTRQYLERICLYEMHIFKYSVREGTRAAGMPEQVDGSKKHARSEQLLQMNQSHKKAFEQNQIGKTDTVLFEEEIDIEGETYFVGHTTRYVKVALKKENIVEPAKVLRQILPVAIRKRLNDEYLLAEWS